MRPSCLVLLLTSVFLSSAMCCGQEQFQYETQFDALVDPYLSQQKFAGISIGVLYDNKSWKKNYGTLDPDGNVPPTSTTLYEIGSISKVLTSILLADAAVSGRLKLDDPIGSIWQELADGNPDVAQSVTLRHLSLHTSGLPVMPSNMAPEDSTNPFAGYSRDLLSDYMMLVRLTRRPGESFEYSNLAAGLLGDLLSRQAGQTYEELLQGRLTSKLGMNDTVIKLSDEQRSRLAPPWNTALLPERTWDFDALAGCGAIRSTVDDMLLLSSAVIQPPEGELGKALELAWSEQKPASNGQLAMGLGWMIAQDGSTRWHNGRTGGYEAIVFISRSSNCAVVLLCNTAGADTDRLATQMIRTLMGITETPVTFEAEFQPNPETVARLAGRYVLAPTAVLTIQVRKNRMMAQITGQQFLALKPASDTDWKYQAVDARLEFELPESGECQIVRLHQNGRILQAQRLPDASPSPP